MARRKHERMSQEKKKFIAPFIEMHDIQIADNIQDAPKDLLDVIIKEMDYNVSERGRVYGELSIMNEADYSN